MVALSIPASTANAALLRVGDFAGRCHGSPPDDTRLNMLLDGADAALYRAKRDGRSRAKCADPDPQSPLCRTVSDSTAATANSG